MNPPLPAHGIPTPGARHHMNHGHSHAHGHGHGHGSGASRGGALPDGEAAA
ncbi:hypothetical protein ACFW9F_02535 [Streptomyces sp. NPDC059506]|uniref:hypothetical protein n=1 Tax=Streptomyces TaxID=1883 RepID=UPI0015F854F0|nr:hypothetical protein [Streptomyces sp. SCUT-3]QMV24725.1 hypothetical protein GQS52_26495 [Streptomyces sp. SCUT-3]